MPRDNIRPQGQFQQNRNPQSHGQQPQEGSSKEKEQVQKIIQQGGKTLVQLAEQLGPRLYSGHLTTSQIRNIYGSVKQMEMRGFNAGEFVLLKPKLAYAAARANTDGARELKNVLTWAIDEVGDDETRFAHFVDFFEAILAYHKAAGGR
jgi:CRISPR-associated protein Csm2